MGDIALVEEHGLLAEPCDAVGDRGADQAAADDDCVEICH
jgi:hypothetical protein